MKLWRKSRQAYPWCLCDFILYNVSLKPLLELHISTLKSRKQCKECHNTCIRLNKHLDIYAWYYTGYIFVSASGVCWWSRANMSWICEIQSVYVITVWYGQIKQEVFSQQYTYPFCCGILLWIDIMIRCSEFQFRILRIVIYRYSGIVVSYF